MKPKRNYVGRYAPSPTGDLHLGNLRTALLAWLQARLHGGHFVLRMEDLDTPRTVQGSADQILRDLEWLGLDWDGDVVFQSRRSDLYQSVFRALDEQGLTYPCFCSRKDIQASASAPHSKAHVYPGTCANLSAGDVTHARQSKAPAFRLRVTSGSIDYVDGVLGPQSEVLTQSCGDFVIKRADGLFAYQLAVVVDDLQQGVSDVVRGADLADSVARQLYLAQLIESVGPPIRYHHVPLMRDQSGQRLAKRDGSNSAAQWRSAGQSAPALVAHFANSLNLLGVTDGALTARELLAELDLKRFSDVLSNL